MAIILSDDGTMDTVLTCTECGKEFRFLFDCGSADEEDINDERMYAAYVEDCIADVESEHECASNDEPQEDDITTTDHRQFYMSGKLVLTFSSPDNRWMYRDTKTASNWVRLPRFAEDDHKSALREFMSRIGYWPNCWVISDHGNAHLMDLSEGKE
jgi:hypothetical protein